MVETEKAEKIAEVSVAVPENPALAWDFPDTVAFVFIAMGPVAMTPGVEYAIASLRRVGGYEGRIYVLTDRPECFLHHGSRNISRRTHVTYVEPPHASLHDTIHNIAYHRTQLRMLKTKIFHYLPTDVEYAAFLDSDVVTTGPECAKDFLNQNIFTGDHGSWPATMAIRTRWGVGSGPHLGSFIIRRNHSETLLQRWADSFTKEDFLDRVSFTKAATALYALPEYDTSDVEAVARRKKFVGTIFRGDRFLNLSMEMASECFVHVSSARCKELGASAVNARLKGIVPGYTNDMCELRGSISSRVASGLERLGVVVGDSCRAKLELHHRGIAWTTVVMYTCGGVFTIVLVWLLVLGCRRRYGKPRTSWAEEGEPKAKGHV